MRMMHSYFRIGGVAADLPYGWIDNSVSYSFNFLEDGSGVISGEITGVKASEELDEGKKDRHEKANFFFPIETKKYRPANHPRHVLKTKRLRACKSSIPSCLKHALLTQTFHACQSNLKSSAHEEPNSSEEAEDSADEVEVYAAEIVKSRQPYKCALLKPAKSSEAEARVSAYTYSFDVLKTDLIFDRLLKDGRIQLQEVKQYLLWKN
uniref:Uncharacterized protein n=1 Tax=Ananas comosus var. bracteatus TaxID=296719 RepID=A0A6V7PF09_ANACO|nr:unnamed protein product [Ananas comosus var. bracteatus]